MKQIEANDENSRILSQVLYDDVCRHMSLKSPSAEDLLEELR